MGKYAEGELSRVLEGGCRGISRHSLDGISDQTSDSLAENGKKGHPGNLTPSIPPPDSKVKRVRGARCKNL